MTSFYEDLGGVLIVLALVIVALAGLILRVRGEWKALRHRLIQVDGSAAKASRPGRAVARIGTDTWDAKIRESISQASRDLSGDPAAAGALETAGADLASLITSIIGEALESGRLRSRLLSLDGVLVYVMALLDRPEDRRKFRGYQAFADGWPAHASAIRQLAAKGSGQPLVGLLYFIGLDAREITLLVAHESDGIRRYPVDLAEPSDGPGAIPGSTFEFAMA